MLHIDGDPQSSGSQEAQQVSPTKTDEAASPASNSVLSLSGRSKKASEASHPARNSLPPAQIVDDMAEGAFEDTVVTSKLQRSLKSAIGSLQITDL